MNFEKWVYAKLAEHLVWPADRVLRAKMIGQAKKCVFMLCFRLTKSGFMFESKELAQIIEAILIEVGTAQKAGRVKVLWPYLRSVMERHVQVNADRLKRESMHLGRHLNQALGATTSRQVSLVETVAQLYADRNKKTQERRQLRKDTEASEKAQRTLFSRASLDRLVA